jgi:murein DD-endopeptidase MepM/ murein hydrolase activator NlpD
VPNPCRVTTLRATARTALGRLLPGPLLLGLLVLCAVAAPALGDDIAGKKQQVDQQIQELSSKLSAQRASENALRKEIDGVTARIRRLEANVGDVSLQLSTLEQDLALHRERLAKLTKLYKLQSNRLGGLQRQYEVAVRRLDRRLVSIYIGGQPSLIEFVFGATSIDDVIAKVDYMGRIAREDRRIAVEVASAKHAMQKARKRTRAVRRQVAGAAHVITARAAQVRETRDALVGARDSLNASKEHKLVALSDLSAQEQAEASEIDALRASSAALGAQIRAAQARTAGGPDATPSSAGLVWPVSGPVTSPFGWRWGRMHEGIDIGVGYGTPIHAAAAGTVIYCGWESGYGNLVVIDHGGNLATAYGHQSSIAVSCGQQVSQGQVIGYVGCTGHCFGPHLHFEVRIGGNPVDPLGYL